MKSKIILIIILVLFTLPSGFAQETYQIFPSAGFKVKCGCTLYVNSTFIQMANQQGANNIIASYICAENQDSPDIGVIVNINIYDEIKNYNNIQPSGYASFEKKYLEKYAADLSSASIT